MRKPGRHRKQKKFRSKKRKEMARKQTKSKLMNIDIPWDAIKTVKRYTKNPNNSCLNCQYFNNTCLVGDPKDWKFNELGLPLNREELEEVELQEFKKAMKEILTFCEKRREIAGCKNCPFNKERKCLVGFPYISWLLE